MKPHVFALLLATSVLGRAQEAPGNNYPFANGIIEKLDPATSQMAVTNALGRKIFLVTDRTYLIDGTERINFDKLKAGDPVVINYTTNTTGQAVIRRLKIKHPNPDALPDKTQ